jgi:hypothetical protein
MDTRKRIIIDFKKLTPELLALLVATYPDGYDDHHITKFKNAHNEWIEAVPLETNEARYLVKVSTKLALTMENYDEEDYAGYQANDPDAIQDPEF